MISPMELLVNLDENPHKNQALTAKNGPQAPPRSAAQWSRGRPIPRLSWKNFGAAWKDQNIVIVI